MLYTTSFLLLFLMSLFTLSSTPADIQHRHVQQQVLNRGLFSPEVFRFLAERALPAITILGLLYNAYRIEFNNAPTTGWFYITKMALVTVTYALLTCMIHR